MDRLLEQQQALMTLISNFILNTKKSGKENLTANYLKTRIELLEKYWEKFEKNHDSLINEASAEDLTRKYFAEDHYVNMEVTYCEVGADLKDMMDEAKSPHQNPTNTSLDPSFTMAAYSISSLPKIHLPRFGGDLKEWPAFHDLFQSLFASSRDLTGSQKLYYLKTSLFGQAEQVLRNLAITDSNYAAAWKVLCERYQNERLLVMSNLRLLTSLPFMKTESADELRRLYDGTIEALEALESLKRSVNKWDDWLVFITVQKLDPTTRRDWENSLSSPTNMPTFTELRIFLQHRITTLEVVGASSTRQKEVNKFYQQKHMVKPSPIKVHLATNKTNYSGKCTKCNGKHLLLFCPLFRRLSVPQRLEFVSKEQICENCLRVNHPVSNCPSSYRCKYCHQPHHTMLHNTQEASTSTGIYYTPKDAINVKDANITGQTTSSTRPITTLSVNLVQNPSTILLATARVRLRSPSGKSLQVRALLDQGSQATFVSSFVSSYLKLQRQRVNIPVQGIGASDGGCVKSMVPLCIQSCVYTDYSIDTLALMLPKLTKVASTQKISIPEMPHLNNLRLADPEFFDNTEINLIIGADIYWSLLLEGLRKGNPTAQNTSLGWILSGPVPAIDYVKSNSVQSHCIALDNASHQVDLLLQKFWEVEEVPTNKEIMSEDEQACETFYKETTRRGSDGRYIVRLPIRPSYQQTVFGDSKSNALQSLHSLERRFNSNPNLRDQYVDFMEEYLRLNHMKIVSNGEKENIVSVSSIFYMPHHGVINENSSSTKLRVVFNGSRKSRGGLALNDYLAVGPKLQSDLAAIVLNWRKHVVVFAADIKMMYRQILVDKQDCDLQRIIWRNSRVEIPLEYRLLTVTYGTTSAPYLAIRTLHQLADDEQLQYPKGSKILRENFYVDDVLFGADDISSALSCQRELVSILQAGGFHLHKWSSNSNEALQLSNIHSSNQDITLSEDTIIKTLGLLWNPTSDSFGFRVTHSDAPAIITKRNLLSDVAKLYDPLGFLSPTIIIAKALFQKLWLLKLDWDTPLPQDITNKWLNFRRELTQLETISIPRWIGYDSSTLSYEIHAFCDASEGAYAAVIYFRALHDFNNIQVSILRSKTKLAPLKRISIPRLELMGAHLLARIVHNLQSTLDIGNVPIYCWTDSLTVLTWITTHPSKWKTFVANRVSHIIELIPSVKWRYVPSRDNPADCASRGIPAHRLMSHSLWWEGPPWLKSASTTWPQHPARHNLQLDGDLEARTGLISVVASINRPTQWDLILNYSSLPRLLRITAYCIRFIRTCKILTENRKKESLTSNCNISAELCKKGPLTPSELNTALLFWVKSDQNVYFSVEYNQLSNRQTINKRSSILSLSPIFDFETHTIRVGGRLQNSELAYDSKHQFLLAKDSPLSALIVADAHDKTLHGGVQMNLNFIRQQFWILGAKNLIRNLSRRCIRCFRQRISVNHQFMGMLPAARVKPTRPFSHSGVDYAGPILVRYGPGRGKISHKAYIGLFVCMATKAVHLELVSDLTTAAFISAFKCFTARRGPCRKIYSDNGTTFVGAAKELRNLLFFYKSQVPEELNHFLTAQGTDWSFIPPNAPNFGGLWEAGVKAVKHHIKRVIGTSTLTFEELYTLLTQIEACVNSRLLYPLSSDPDDLEALTPGHFLIGSAFLTTPEPSLEDVNSHRLSRWKLVHQMYEHFWSRWSKDYLNNLQARTKWTHQYKNIKPGLLVLIRDDRLPPSYWSLGRIEKVYPGPDHLVRVATIKTHNHLIKLPLNKLCILPVQDKEDVMEDAVSSGRAEVPHGAQDTQIFRPRDEAGGNV